MITYKDVLVAAQAVLMPLLRGSFASRQANVDKKTIAAPFRRKESRVLNCPPTACRNRTDAGGKNHPERGRAWPDHPAVSRRVEGAPAYFSDIIEPRAAAGPARDTRDPPTSTIIAT